MMISACESSSGTISLASAFASSRKLWFASARSAAAGSLGRAGGVGSVGAAQAVVELGVLARAGVVFW